MIYKTQQLTKAQAAKKKSMWSWNDSALNGNNTLKHIQFANAKNLSKLKMHEDKKAREIVWHIFIFTKQRGARRNRRPLFMIVVGHLIYGIVYAKRRCKSNREEKKTQ